MTNEPGCDQEIGLKIEHGHWWVFASALCRLKCKINANASDTSCLEMNVSRWQLNISALLWCLNVTEYSESQRERLLPPRHRIFPLLAFSHLKTSAGMNMKQQTSLCLPDRIIRNTQSLVGINLFFFLMSNISLVSAVTGEQLFPSRQQDRRHPIRNTQANKYNLPSSPPLCLSPSVSNPPLVLGFCLFVCLPSPLWLLLLQTMLNLKLQSCVITCQSRQVTR